MTNQERKEKLLSEGRIKTVVIDMNDVVRALGYYNQNGVVEVGCKCIPTDAVFYRAFTDPGTFSNHKFGVMLLHESFDAVPTNEVVPVQHCYCRKDLVVTAKYTLNGSSIDAEKLEKRVVEEQVSEEWKAYSQQTKKYLLAAPISVDTKKLQEVGRKMAEMQEKKLIESMGIPEKVYKGAAFPTQEEFEEQQKTLVVYEPENDGPKYEPPHAQPCPCPVCTQTIDPASSSHKTLVVLGEVEPSEAWDKEPIVHEPTPDPFEGKKPIPTPAKIHVLVGGYITSLFDGQRHYISPRRLQELYKLTDEQVMYYFDNENEYSYAVHDHRLRATMHVKLKPREDGDYRLPTMVITNQQG